MRSFICYEWGALGGTSPAIFCLGKPPTLLRPDSGSARIFGHDVVREADTVRSRISLTGQFASVDADLTGAEYLILLARLAAYPGSKAARRAHELLEAFDLASVTNRQVKTYSGGMHRRLDIAASLVALPDLLFLDEPTTGLDPQSRTMIWEIVRELVTDGMTVLLTTQYLEEADQLADRIAVIDHGKIIAEGTSGELKASVGAGSMRLRLISPVQRPLAQRALAQALGTPVHLEADQAALTATVPADASQGVSGRIASLFGVLSQAGVAVADFSLGQPSLDEVFLALTGHPTPDTSTTPEEEHVS